MVERATYGRKIGWETLLVAVLVVMTFVPFLGENLFSTKGEPREAVIAVSMLNSGNWVLPVTFGAEIPYKPPMLAWCIAALGWLNGGVVTEFLSRLPSALAAVMMLMAGFRLFARYASVNRAVAMALITAGCFEFFRNGTICRVDMLVTMFIVTALYAFFRQSARHPGGTWAPSVWAVLLMSGGVLTKGPVGMLLPCMVVFVYRLLRGNNFWKTCVSVGVSAVLSLILPAMWYVAAYNQGGEEFLRLAMEENFGRFTGTMSYESHENPAWYNLLTLAYGCAPYTLLLLMSLFVLPWKRLAESLRRGGSWPRRFWSWLRSLDPLTLFSLLAVVLIFGFYCIPKSKRSVYLLPVYPFVAYFITLCARWLITCFPRLVKTWCWIICVVGFVASGVVHAVMFGAIPLVGDVTMQSVMSCLQSESRHFWPVAFTVLTFLCAFWLGRELVCSKARAGFGWCMAYVLAIYWMVSCAVLPAAMNVKSDRPLAALIEEAVGEEAPVYSWRPDPMWRYYTINYYMGDRLLLFDVEKPVSGYLLVGEEDFPVLRDNAASGYLFSEVLTTGGRSSESGQRLKLLRFVLKNNGEENITGFRNVNQSEGMLKNNS